MSTPSRGQFVELRGSRSTRAGLTWLPMLVTHVHDDDTVSGVAFSGIPNATGWHRPVGRLRARHARRRVAGTAKWREVPGADAVDPRAQSAGDDLTVIPKLGPAAVKMLAKHGITTPRRHVNHDGRQTGGCGRGRRRQRGQLARMARTPRPNACPSSVMAPADLAVTIRFSPWRLYVTEAAADAMFCGVMLGIISPPRRVPHHGVGCGLARRRRKPWSKPTDGGPDCSRVPVAVSGRLHVPLPTPSSRPASARRGRSTASASSPRSTSRRTCSR